MTNYALSDVYRSKMNFMKHQNYSPVTITSGPKVIKSVTTKLKKICPCELIENS